jgi:hypothetical protein
VQQSSVDGNATYPLVIDDTAEPGQISHSAEPRLSVSPLATVLQGGRATDSVQRLIHIAQNLSLQAPESPVESPNPASSRGTMPSAHVTMMGKSPDATTMGDQFDEQQIDWKDRERGFLHRQLLHNLFFRHSCTAVVQDRSHSPSRESDGAG